MTGGAARFRRCLVMADLATPRPLEVEPAMAAPRAVTHDAGKPAVAGVREAVGNGAREKSAGEWFLRRDVAFPSGFLFRQRRGQAHALQGLGRVEGKRRSVLRSRANAVVAPHAVTRVHPRRVRLVTGEAVLGHLLVDLPGVEGILP